MTSDDKQPVTVWDVPTRVFHWLLAALVALNLILGGEDAGILFTVHVVSGYLIATLLAFRLVWGIIGGRHARFGDFVTGWGKTRQHLNELLRLHPSRYVGHNPLGGWMVIALLVGLTLAVITGLFGHGGHTAGPLSGALPSFVSGFLGDVHGLIANILIALIGLHIAGVLADWLLTRENIVRAMITGRKQLSPAEAAREPAPTGPWRAIVLVVLLLVLFGAALGRTNFQALQQGHNSEDNHTH